MVLMVLAEEARVEAAGFGQLGFGEHLIDAAIEVLAARWIRDRAVETEFHGSPLSAVLECDLPLAMHRETLARSPTNHWRLGCRPCVTCVMRPRCTRSAPGQWCARGR